MSSRIRKLLIANRGEIACRVIRSARKLGIRTVAVYSDADVGALHVSQADEAYNVGRASAEESYLRGDRLMEVAKRCGADAVHPGYGFLSENAEFAELCAESGVKFIGPPPSAIRDMGVKSTSKEIMSKAGVEVIPGYHGGDQSEGTLVREAVKIGFPLMVKAVRGGGGKGMRIVREESELVGALESAKRESLRSFGDDTLLLERYIPRPRHIEVQIFGDVYGNYVHLFERDCSIQRRHQKVLEQAPAPNLSPHLRQSLSRAGVKAAAAVNYVGAGTVEFILDTDTDKFYFMEMNTRLQVEHAVSEMVTGVDLVEWQLKVGGGERLSVGQEELSLNGHSVEARIYAEDVPSNFLPQAGRLLALDLPQHHNTVRVDTGVRGGDEVSVHYDPMIAKLVVWDEHLSGALSRLDTALSQFNIVGVKNNVNFLRRLCRHADVISGNLHTGFIDLNRDTLITCPPLDHRTIFHAALATLLKDEGALQRQHRPHITTTTSSTRMVGNDPFSCLTDFRVNASHQRKITIRHDNTDYCVNCVRCGTRGEFQLEMDGSHLSPYQCRATLSVSNPPQHKKQQQQAGGGGVEFYSLRVETPEWSTTTKLAYNQDSMYLFSGEEDVEVSVVRDYVVSGGSGSGVQGVVGVVSPMPGVVDKMLVVEGESVTEGQPVAVVMAMKMEHIVRADRDGVICSVLYKAGDSVPKNSPLVTFQQQQQEEEEEEEE